MAASIVVVAAARRGEREGLAFVPVSNVGREPRRS